MLIELLPGWVLQSLPAIGLLVVGYVVERHYVSRVTCFTNALALNVYVLGLSDPSWLLTLYTDIGLIVGIAGMVAYANRITLGDWYYLTAFFLYASAPVGAVVLLPTPFLPTLLFAGILNYGAGYVVSKAGVTVLYDGGLPGSVARFLDENTVDYEEYRDGVDLLVRI
jgi:hypothetical protein